MVLFTNMSFRCSVIRTMLLIYLLFFLIYFYLFMNYILDNRSNAFTFRPVSLDFKVSH